MFEVEESDRSCERFVVSAGATLELTDTRRKQTSTFDVVGEAGRPDRQLIETLASVANRQTGQYDPLFNGLEAADAIVVYLKQKFPALRQSDVLRPFMTLRGAAHDLIVGARSDLFSNRMPQHNGAYRWPENCSDDFSEGSRPTRTCKDLMQAVILVAYKSLLVGHVATDADKIVGQLLSENGIGLVNDKPGTGPDAEVVKRWWRRHHEKGRKPSIGRKYCFDELCKVFEAQLAAAADPAVGLTLATDLIDRVRFDQPTGWFVPSQKDLGY